MVLLTDVLKAFVAKKIKGILKESIIKKMNQVVGVLLFFFGVVLIARALMSYY
jgi:hypothetical protein